MVKLALGPRLRKIREKHRVNMRDLADVCGIDFSLISRYENGERDFSEETFWQLRDGIDKVLDRKKEQEQAKEEIGKLLAARKIEGNGLLRYAALKAISEGKKVPAFPSLDESLAITLKEKAERERQLAVLEKLQSDVNDSALSEVIASFRREIKQKDVRITQLEAEIRALRDED